MAQRLTLEGISRSVNGEVYLSGIQMTFEPGTLTTLFGRTRAGKTSLLRVLAGLDHPDSGVMRLGGRDITKLGVRQRDVSMVYQQFVNYPSLTVYENIASPLQVRGRMAARDVKQRVQQMASVLRIDHLLDRLPETLSGGQQQRVAIARALVKEAKLILLDEPLANLDYKLREELRRELHTLFSSSDAVVVYATTEPSEALQLGGRTAVLDEGRLLQVGAPRQIYDAPVHARVGQVFSDPEMNLLDAHVDDHGQLRLGPDALFPMPEVLAGLRPGPYRFGIRAYHVLAARSSPADLQLSASVLLQEASGSETIVHARCGIFEITAQLPGIHRYALGEKLSLFLNPSRILVFDAQGWSISDLQINPALPTANQAFCHGAD